MKCDARDDVEKVAVIRSEDGKLEGWGYRHQQCVILFLCLTTCYSMRACMGVSLVAMTTSSTTRATIYNHTNLTSYNASDYKVNGILSALLLTYPYPIFKWNKKTQDAILASFFWGYMVLQVPAGQLAHRVGARRLLAAALFVNALVSFCLPWAAYYGGWAWVAVFRIKQGLSQACIMPGMHTLLGKWTPLRERSRLTAWVHGGHALGPVLGLPVTGFIASSSVGWPGVFRFYGVLAALVGALIWCLTADTPAKHPNISYSEKEYIENDIGSSDDSQKAMSVPWRKILSHRGMYAIVAAHIAQAWGQLILYGELPDFMDKVMGVNIKANGMLTALPFLVMWFTNFFFSWAADKLIVKKILSVTHTRKLATSVGSLSAAIGLIVLAFVPKKLVIVESVLVVLVGLKVATHAGVYVNNIDISPNFSGTLMSISNFISNLCASLAPIVNAFILTDVTSEYLWRKVFFVTAGIYFVSNLVYLICGTAERAEWNDPPQKKNTTNVEECNPMLDTAGK
ncbi:PREDICTED: putative inorganic phosphate cotransporter [Papilio xuthus]|uniref:Inorganic phosphate cotransporter n=1 Tax=Papilio xuthus TaxID=66420 RepID=A0AAJ6ZWE3_PAPXU|nr:PREDICTED: putative inorganic phosphate cotransporter [Papilio xuthus]